MTPELDLPEGIGVEPDGEHDWIIEIWRRLSPDPSRAGEGFERLGFVDTFSGHVHLDDGSGENAPSRDARHDVDWMLRRAKSPRGSDGRAVGHPRA